MKIATLLAMLMLTQAQAIEPYPEYAGDLFPVDHWQLSMVSRTEIIDIDTPGFENYSRHRCIREGMRRMQQTLDAPFGAELWLGFVCDFVKG